MTAKKTYTIADISRELGIAESTLRYWRDRYSDFIPVEGSGRKKRYKEEALSVFSKIAELTAESKTAEEVAEALNTEMTRIIEVPQDNSSNAAAKGLPVERLTQVLETMADQQQRIEKLENKLEETEKRVEQKLDERDQKLMETIRELQNKKKPWWKRIFNRE